MYEVKKGTSGMHEMILSLQVDSSYGWCSPNCTTYSTSCPNRLEENVNAIDAPSAYLSTSHHMQRHFERHGHKSQCSMWFFDPKHYTHLVIRGMVCIVSFLLCCC